MSSYSNLYKYVECCDGCGSQGDMGATGATGPQGETGPTGPTGVTGPIIAALVNSIKELEARIKILELK